MLRVTCVRVRAHRHLECTMHMYTCLTVDTRAGLPRPCVGRSGSLSFLDSCEEGAEAKSQGGASP